MKKLENIQKKEQKLILLLINTTWEEQIIYQKNGWKKIEKENLMFSNNVKYPENKKKYTLPTIQNIIQGVKNKLLF